LEALEQPERQDKQTMKRRGPSNFTLYFSTSHAKILNMTLTGLVILLTAFEPFAGRSQNLSMPVAETVRDELQAQGALVTVCRLPVVYDRAEEAAARCYERMNPKPRIVLGLGEGTCEIRLETAAHNLDDGALADNSGVRRQRRPILPSGPATVAFHWPAQALYCAASEADALDRLVVSKTPGGFVCNNTAYRMAHRFLSEPTLQYGFIHVPHAACPAQVHDPASNGRLIARMLRGLVAHGAAAAPSAYPLPHATNTRRLPTTPAEVDTAMQALDAAPANACARDFLRLLREQLAAKKKG
jgi:pyrrolidone-carboxylate peptidase